MRNYFLALVSLAAIAIPLLLIVGVSAAYARTCNTTCNTYGGQTSCTTQCW